MSGEGFRVSIPNSVRMTIHNIREITGNHSDEEIYAMLKECSMDPNETTQKLLLQDPFHEVKRKRDRKKENTSNKEPQEPRWRSNIQGRGSGGGRISYSTRHASHDAGGGRNSNSASGKEYVSNHVSEKRVAISPSPTTQESKNNETTVAGPVTVMADGPNTLPSGSTSATHATTLSGGGGVNQPDMSSNVDVSKLGSALALLPSVTTNKIPTIAFGKEDTRGQPTSSSIECSASMTPTTSPAVCFSSSDPVLVPSHDSRLRGALGTIKREVGSQLTPDAIVPAESKSTAAEIAILETESSFVHGKMSSKSQAVGKNQFTETSQHSPLLTHGVSSFSWPSSNYNFRSQQFIGPQKVGPIKEWKPKPTNSNPAQGSGTTGPSEVPTISVEVDAVLSEPALSVVDSEEATSKVQRKLGELHIQEHQNVIIPNHIHVPESARSGLSFGSIDASFGVNTSYVSCPESDKSSTAVSETSHGIEETVEELPSSNQSTSASVDERDYPDHPQSPTHVPKNVSSVEGDVSVPEYNESKQETAFLNGGQPYSMHTSLNYGFGFMPPILGSQLAPFENSDSQARDASRVPSFLVQQPFDPASYYAQFYRSGADSDGRLSPFPSAGVAAKYNGNVAVMPPQTSQAPQEGVNSLVLSTAGLSPLVTKAGGVMQSSISVTQQPVGVFRPPTGAHISHYPPNYIPYGHYFSPYYVPPPAIHQFLNNGAFPQTGRVYAAPQAAAGTGVKYSLPQFKPGDNAGNPTHIEMTSGYGPYGSSPAGYNPSTTATSGNSTTSEDLAASQFKENNVFIPGRQSEGSGVWIAAPGRDISSLPASSFYNLPQGQHVTFAPSQAGHGTFAGIYHPGQAVTAATVHPLLQQSQTMSGSVDMVGPATNVYQQPQLAQINWPSNY